MDTELQLFRFDGETYDPEQDQGRLSSQTQRVYKVMLDYQWHTLAELTEKAAPGTEAAISARLRDLRKVRFGGHTVERARVDGGLWRYRLIPAQEEQ